MTADAPDTSITSGDVQDLAVAVEQLTDETRLLRMSLDELRDDVVWAARQVLAAGYQVTGTAPPAPRDPLAPDLGRSSSRARPDSLAIERATDRVTEDDDGALYCCDRPRLAWNGDPDAPGVACENCGYVVADMGNVVIRRGTSDSKNIEVHDSQNAPLREQQGHLFE
jgi:hypothetical protein